MSKNLYSYPYTPSNCDICCHLGRRIDRGEEPRGPGPERGVQQTHAYSGPARGSYNVNAYSGLSYVMFLAQIYCVFFQEFSKVYHLPHASARLLLVVQKITSQ